jgi:hypothetical protein
MIGRVTTQGTRFKVVIPFVLAKASLTGPSLTRADEPGRFLEAGDKTKRNASVEAREISFVPRLLIIFSLT